MSETINPLSGVVQQVGSKLFAALVRGSTLGQGHLPSLAGGSLTLQASLETAVLKSPEVVRSNHRVRAERATISRWVPSIDLGSFRYGAIDRDHRGSGARR